MDFIGSLSDLNKAIELDDNYFDAYFKRGVVNNQLGKVEAAIQDFTKAVNLKKSFAESYFNLGICFHEINDLKKSTENFKKYLELKPGDNKAKILLEQVMNELTQAKY